jgi:hypothetical protein
MKQGIVGVFVAGGFAAGAIKIHDSGVTFHNPLQKEPYEMHLRERGDALSLETAATLRSAAQGEGYWCTLQHQGQTVTLTYEPREDHSFIITIPKGEARREYRADNHGLGESYSECRPQDIQGHCSVYLALNSVAQIYYLSDDPPSTSAYEDISRQRELTSLLLEFSKNCTPQ